MSVVLHTHFFTLKAEFILEYTVKLSNINEKLIPLIDTIAFYLLSAASKRWCWKIDEQESPNES